MGEQAIAQLAQSIKQLDGRLRDVSRHEHKPANLLTGWRIFNVQQQPYGAIGNGTGDDTAASQAAAEAAHAAGGGIVYYPTGIYPLYANGLLLRHTAVVFKGDGMYNSILRAGEAMNAVVQSTATPVGPLVVFEDLCFDGNHLTVYLAAIIGHQTLRAIFRRCLFMNYGTIALHAAYTPQLVLEDCEGWNPGTGDGTFVNLAEGVHDAAIRRCRWEWCANGVIAATESGGWPDGARSQHLRIEDCWSDLGWYLLPAIFSGSGGTVTYTATVLTDTGAAFTGLSGVFAFLHDIRAMPTRSTGTAEACDGSSLYDAGATFLNDGILVGEIVRMGTAWAFVTGVESDTKIRVERWLDQTTYAPAAPPALGTYTVYGLYLGRLNAFTGTTLTVDRWHDLTGATVTPSAGTYYEVPRNRPDYPINIAGGARLVTIRGNTLLRGWSDQISVFGNEADIHDNVIRDGQDVGITAEHYGGVGRHTVHDNTVHHQGGSGIWIGGPGSIVHDNQLSGPTPWQNAIDTTRLATGVVVAAATYGGVLGGTRITVHHNQIDGGSYPLAQRGICLDDNVSDCLVDGNSLTGHTVADITLEGSANGFFGANRLRDNAGAAGAAATMNHTGFAPGQDYGILWGTGTPEAVVTAGIGTLFRRTDTGAVYRKTSGAGNTGWVTP